ncbi:hypothetical protein [Kribbella sp. CCNWLW201]
MDAAITHALNGVKYDALGARVAAMSARYRAEQLDDTTLGMADDLDCLAYAVFRMPATYHAIRTALPAVDSQSASRRRTTGRPAPPRGVMCGVRGRSRRRLRGFGR